MSEIRKYSKEWFVNNGVQQQKDAMKKANYSTLIIKEGTKPEDYKFEKDFFVGTKEEVRARHETAKQLGKNSNERVITSVSGGIDNIFDILDENGDGTVTPEEMNTFSAVDSDDVEDRDDESFSIKDFQTVFDNVVKSDGAVYTQIDNKTEQYVYKDGSVTQIIKDDAGNIQEKNTFQVKGLELHQTKTDYTEKKRVETITDSDGRVRYESVDKSGRVNDVTTTRTFDDEGRIKTVKKETAGKFITDDYDYDKNTKTTTTTLKYTSDGVIGDTKQQSIGNCWVLAGTNGLKDIPKGAQAIKDAIRQHEDGSVTVMLKGVNRSYTFTPEEIGAHDYVRHDKEYSKGDIDMNLIEMAVTKYRQELVSKGKSTASADDPTKSGYTEDTIFYLTGKKTKCASVLEITKNKYLKNKEKNPDRYVLTVDFKNADSTIPGGKILTQHAYHIKRVTNDTVYVVNPHDSSKEIAYPRDKFLQNAWGVTQTDFK